MPALDIVFIGRLTFFDNIKLEDRLYFIGLFDHALRHINNDLPMFLFSGVAKVSGERVHVIDNDQFTIMGG